ncbi:MAG TPA: TadE/TadG family type IV pilus assembly protein [Kiloniellales bacterium]|jgi:Flp pilus assembly protein TadG
MDTKMVRSFLKWLRRGLIDDRRGGVMVEFAMIIPILVFVLLAGVDVVRFAMLQQKLSRAATSMADLVAQYPTMSQTQLDQLFLSVQHIITPFPLGSSGRVIVSSISKADVASPVVVDWQRFGAGTASAVSAFGVQGGNAVLPAGFSVDAGQGLIVAEIFYDFDPLLNTAVVPPRRVTHNAIFRPRFGALSALAP